MLTFRQTKYQPIEITLDVNPKGKFVWLQKLAYKVLLKFGTKHVHSSLDYEEYTVNTKRIVQELNKHRWIAEEVWGLRCEYLVLGYDMQMRFDMDPTVGQFIMPQFAMGNGNERREIMGLKVVLIPYIDGFFALPKL